MQVNKQTSQNELMENVNVEIQDTKLLAIERQETTGSLDIVSLKKEAKLPPSKYKYMFKRCLNDHDVRSRSDLLSAPNI